jgi:Protein of unknown function (DUF3307)
MITADQLLAHATGDYLIQSDWMAQNKTEHSGVALAHALSYTLPFLLLTESWAALAFIAGTHFVIDRYRLARYVVYAKNLLVPKVYRPYWADCRETGYPSVRPAWLKVWLLIIADNVLHVVCNGLALGLQGAR